MQTGTFTNEGSLIRAGHRVLSCVLAAYDFDLLRRDGDSDPMDTFLQFEEQEISESILILAAVARIADDERATLKAVESNFPEGVGVLTEDGKDVHLTIREACNKIIHSKASRFELEWADENPIWTRWYKAQGHEVKGRYKSPKLLLEGARQNGKPWTASIELVPFVLAASMWDMWKWKLA